MARLWSAGFELQSAANGIEYDTKTGTTAINTTTKRSGAASLRCNPSASTGLLTHRVRADATTKIFMRIHLYIATAPSALTTIMDYGDGTFFGVSIRLATNSTLELWDDVAKIGSSSSALTGSTWYRIELVYDDSIADNTMWAYLNGVQFATGTGIDIAGGGVVKWGIQTSTTADIYIDDVAANDTAAGAGQTGLPGAGSIVHLRPSATGDNSGGTYTGDTAGWNTTDEITPDDATTYTALTVANTDILDVNCDNSSVPGIGQTDTVSLVAVGMRLTAASAAATATTLRLKSAASGTVSSSAAIAHSVTAWNTHDDTAGAKQYKLTSYTDPTTGVAWTPTGTNSLDNMQIGILSTDVTTNPWHSTLWALVEYVPSTIIPNKGYFRYQAVKRSNFY